MENVSLLTISADTTPPLPDFLVAGWEGEMEGRAEERIWRKEDYCRVGVLLAFSLSICRGPPS